MEIDININIQCYGFGSARQLENRSETVAYKTSRYRAMFHPHSIERAGGREGGRGRSEIGTGKTPFEIRPRSRYYVTREIKDHVNVTPITHSIYPYVERRLAGFVRARARRNFRTPADFISEMDSHKRPRQRDRTADAAISAQER